MQSFAGKVKNELGRTPVQRLCCARAEAYGVLLYGNTFSPTEVRLITESADFAARLPRLFQRAFGLKFDRLPEEERGKLIFGITDRSKLDRIINQLGYDPRQNLVLHVNFGLLEDECCRTAFLRGAFLAGGSVTDPEKRYHAGAGSRPCPAQPGGGGPADGDGLSAPQRPPRWQLRYLLQAVRAYRGSADHHRGPGGGYGYHDRQGG